LHHEWLSDLRREPWIAAESLRNGLAKLERLNLGADDLAVDMHYDRDTRSCGARNANAGSVSKLLHLRSWRPMRAGTAPSPGLDSGVFRVARTGGCGSN
jgi:hypothetical protein